MLLRTPSLTLIVRKISLGRWAHVTEGVAAILSEEKI